MCNLYIFALAYLSWPQEVKFKEYEINLGGDSVADVAPGGTQIEMKSEKNPKL